ncbi:MAG: HAMP domain-containing sensor histidine kinase [Gemmatimonadota bacterium]
MPPDLPDHVVARLRAEVPAVAERWVVSVNERIVAGGGRPMDSKATLEHLPRVLHALAASVQNPTAAIVDGAVRESLGALADRRRGQGAPVDEVLADFRFLADLVEDIAASSVADFSGVADPGEFVRVGGRLQRGIAELGAGIVARYRVWGAREHRERMHLLEGYTAMLSHELGNRLGAAETAVHLLIEAGITLPEEQRRRLLGLIVASIESALSTVQGVRALFRPRQPGEPEDVRSMPLGTVIRDSVHQLRAPASERGVELRLQGSGPEEPVDAERFPLAFLNLVTNAIEHHDVPAGVGRVDIEVGDRGERWVITVSDDGPGIPRELRSRVFEPLVRPAGGGGPGLGLAIARDAVEQMGGEIGFECGEDRGTVFHFTIPKRRGTQGTKGAASQ